MHYTQLCKTRGLALHLDGARLFNAIMASRHAAATITADPSSRVTAYGAEDIGHLFDSISICLSKGLGCPVGSLLIGALRGVAVRVVVKASLAAAIATIHVLNSTQTIYTCISCGALQCCLLRPQAQKASSSERGACGRCLAVVCGKQGSWQQLACTRWNTM